MERLLSDLDTITQKWTEVYGSLNKSP